MKTRKKAGTPHPNSLKNLEKGMAKAGQPSLNPTGRPKGAKNRSTVIKYYLEAVGDFENPITQKVESMPVEHAMALSMVKEVINNGNVSAYNTLNDNAYGKLTDKLETKKDISEITDEELAKELINRMMKNHGWTIERAIKGVAKRFPDINLEQLTDD